MTTIAAAVYDAASSYDGLASDSAFSGGLTAIAGANNGAGKDLFVKTGGAAFCVVAKLNEKTGSPAVNKVWCVDSTGFKGEIADYASCDATNATCAAD